MRAQKINNVLYQDGKQLIQEADILLFKGNNWYSHIIERFTESQYSHVGLASWPVGAEGGLELIDFTSAHGGASTNLDNYFPKFSGQIDVYRPDSQYQFRRFNPITKTVEDTYVELNNRAITNNMRSITGLPYGWKRMWWIVKKYLVGFRWFDYDSLKMNSQDVVFPICSTAVAWAFSHSGFMLLRNRNDGFTTPADLSRTPVLNYLFTLI